MKIITVTLKKIKAIITTSRKTDGEQGSKLSLRWLMAGTAVAS